MPTITMPDGTNLEFEDGTDYSVMKNVVDRMYPSQQLQQFGTSSRDLIIQAMGRSQEQQIYGQIAGEKGALGAFAVGAGKGMADIARGVGMMEPPEESEKRAYQALEQRYPKATTVGEIAGETAPFLPAGVAAGALPSAMARVGAAGALGAVESAIERRGEGATVGEQAKAAGVGAGVGAVAEAVMPTILRKAGTLVRRVLGRPARGALIDQAGKPTAELMEALDKEGISFEDFTQQSQKEMMYPKGKLNPEQAARKAYLESKGFVEGAAPTRAQIRRTADDFVQQQQAMKSGVVRGRLENQNALIENQFDDKITQLAKERSTTGSPVFDHVLNTSTELDNKIGAMYDMARQATKNDPVIAMPTIEKALKDYAKEDKLTKGLVSAIKNAAEIRGLMAPDGTFRRISVEEAEDMIKEINARYSKSDANMNRIAKIFKNAIDDDVTKAGGSDLFKEARLAKAKFHQRISRKEASKFSRRNIALVEDILTENIDPDNFLNKGVLSTKYRSRDIADLRKFLSTGTDAQKAAGKKVWDDLRAETMDWIKESAFKGPLDQQGRQTITRARLESAMKKIGPNKLKEMFSPEEMKFLTDMRKTLQLLEPVPGTALGTGPTGEAVQRAVASLKRRIDKLPILGTLVDLDWDRGAGVLKASPVVGPQPTYGASMAAAPTVSETTKEQEQNQ